LYFIEKKVAFLPGNSAKLMHTFGLPGERRKCGTYISPSVAPETTSGATPPRWLMHNLCSALLIYEILIKKASLTNI